MHPKPLTHTMKWLTDSSVNLGVGRGAGEGYHFLVAGLLVTFVAVLVAIRFRSAPLAGAIVLLYGLGFFLLAWYRLSLAVLGLLISLPLITVEIGVGDVEKTLSTDKAAIAAVVSVWLVRRLPWAWPDLRGLWVVRWWIILLAFIVLSGLSNGVTPGEAWGVAKQVLYAGVFLVALDSFVTSKVPVSRLGWAAGLTGSIVALLALVEWFSLSQGHWFPLYFRQGTVVDPYWHGSVVLGSTIAHVNFLAGCLILMAPMMVVIWLRTRLLFPGLAFWGVVFYGLALSYANSLGAWLGLGAGFALALFFSALSGIRRLALIAAFGLLVLLGTGALLFTSVSKSSSLAVRVATHRIGFSAIAERPFFGFGSKGYERASSRFEEMIYGNALQKFHSPASENLSAHSSFLQVLVDRGLLGFAAFVGLLLAVVVPGLRRLSLMPDGDARRTLLALTAGVVAFIVQSFSENLFDYSKVAAVFWIMAALLVRLADRDAFGEKQAT